MLSDHNGIKLEINYQNNIGRDFLGSPVGKTPHSQCRGPRFNPLVRELDPTCMPQLRVHMLQLRVCMPQLRSPHAATKKPTCHN